MTTKTVYSFDPNTLSFLGAITLDQSDLSPLDLAEGREAWMLPGNCVETPPPVNVPAGMYAAAVDGSWEIRSVPVPVGVKATEAAAQVTRVITTLEHANALSAAVQQHLDATARAHRFNDIAEAVTYASSPVPKYYGQGRAFTALRDHTWALVEPIIDDIAAGKIDPIKLPELAAKLPIYDAIQADSDAAILQLGVNAIAAQKAAHDAPQRVPELAPVTPEAIEAATAAVTAATPTPAPAASRRSKKAA